MANTIVNCDGSITITPQRVVRPTSVEQIQEVLRDVDRFPGPVPAMGSCHSLTPCFATDGTIIDMRDIDRVVRINADENTFTAEAGLQIVKAADALRDQGLQFFTNTEIGNMTLATNLLYSTLRLFGGITLLAPDKTADYSETRQSARYAFTFWAFPHNQWLDTLRAYVDFAEDHHRRTGFRCNMPLGSYFIRKDVSSLLSYTHDGDIFSIDPIHAATDNIAWFEFLKRFNDFAFERHGIPLMNQSPFVERKHVQAAYGDRWTEFSNWVKAEDPNGRC